ncbi:unnamed protein product [Paramecium octaurelia]|uniref:Transmembrane protein n=1 Tax=Paramecium octaurelia TaxID=43137 RepID=A0A8S1YJT8_PAROT|nr:unnamed protein product [Paramecium octaurelia]
MSCSKLVESTISTHLLVLVYKIENGIPQKIMQQEKYHLNVFQRMIKPSQKWLKYHHLHYDVGVKQGEHSHAFQEVYPDNQIMIDLHSVASALLFVLYCLSWVLQIFLQKLFQSWIKVKILNKCYKLKNSTYVQQLLLYAQYS